MRQIAGSETVVPLAAPHEKIEVLVPALVRDGTIVVFDNMEWSPAALENQISIAALVHPDDQNQNVDVHRLSLEPSDLIVWTATADGVLTDVGDRLAVLTGVSREQLIKSQLRNCLHPHEADGIFRQRRRSVLDQQQSDFELRLRNVDGSFDWWRWRSAPQRDDTGDVIKWYGTLENIKNRRRAEGLPWNSEDVLRHALKLSNLIAWTADAEGESLNISRRIFKRLGLTRATIRSMRPIAFFHPQDTVMALAALDAGRRQGTSVDSRLRLRHADGSYNWWRLRASTLRDKNEKIIRWYGTLENVDATIAAENRLAQLRAEMVQLSRLNAMGTMASTLAHELNQPLAALTHYLSGCRRLLGPIQPESVAIRDAIGRAAESALRASDIVRQLREQVSISECSRANETVASLIDHACGTALLGADELGIVVTTELDPAAATIYIDLAQVQQLVTSTLQNAVEAAAAADVRQILIQTRLADGFCVFNISDSGRCRADQMAARPLAWTTGDRIDLHCSISRTIAESQGGRIEYGVSSLGGTRVTISLPIAEAC